LAFQAAMLASIWALAIAKNSLASRSRLWPRARETAWANRHQCPGGVSLCGPSAQYSARTFCRSVRVALCRRVSVTSWSSSSSVVSVGPGGRNWFGEVSAKGVTVPQWGVRYFWTTMLPLPSGWRSGCQWNGSLTWSGVLTGT
jgi:hypothetical protein